MFATDPDILKIPSENLFPVVGVGASAGGLDAFRKFVKAIPEQSGMAFILVQHLHPGYNSSLSDIIRKDTTLPVVEITNNIHVEPNYIYVIPANRLLIATDGVLKLASRPPNKKNNAIDVFFSSIAEVHGHFSIGVLLSGKGSDGTKGMQEIKQHGGVTFVQKVSSAAFPDMPQHAINAGAGDFMLDPEDIPPELVKLKRAKSLSPENVHVEGQIDEYYFKHIYALLLIRKDVDFTFYKQTTVRRRILRRMAILKQERISEYLELLKNNKAEQDLLFQDMLIPVTEFFRDPEAFGILCESVYPDLLKGKSLKNPLRMWIAGCSTGQEVYSQAIALQECLGEKLVHVRVQIFATDVSEKAITKARNGVYLKKELKGVSEERLQRFFNNNMDGSFQIKKEVRDMCIFANHNFLKNPPFAKLDLISCRNVLIYMNVFLQRKAFHIFHYALNEQGILLLGKSETNINAPELFGVFDKKNKIYVRKEAPDRFAHIAGKNGGSYIEHKNELVRKMREKVPDFQKEADKILIDQYAPPAVIVNDHFDIVQFLGASGSYLQPSPGKASLNVLKMVRDSFSFELRNALHTAKITREPFVREDISADRGGRLVTIEVIPLVNAIEPYFLIIFKERASRLIIPEATPNGAKGSIKDARIRQLEKELSRLREDIRNITEDQEIVNEELQSANEELLSDSEELQSLNEELETSTEELQSTNEELMSVNQELFVRNDQLNNSRQVAETIVATLHEPLVILDKDYRIKSANRSFFRTFRLKAEECLVHILFELRNNAWDIPILRKAIAAARRKSGAIIEGEFSHVFPVIGKRTVCFHIQQIRAEVGTLSYVVALEDVTERKRIEKADVILKERQTFRDFFMQSNAAFCVLKGPDHIFEFANAAFCKLIGDRDPRSRKMREMLPELEAAGLYKILYHVYHTGKPYSGKGIPLSVSPEDGVRKELILNFNFQAFTDINDEVEGILVVVYDVTETTRAQRVIRESEIRYRSLISGLPIAVYTCDAQGYIRLYNKAAVELWGREPEVGKERWCGSWKLFSTGGEPLEPDRGPLAIAVKEGRIVNTEFIIQRPDGTRRQVVPHPEAKYDSRGNITEAVNTLIDVTDSVAAMREIEVSELKFREMANNVPSLIWVSDNRGQRNFFNKSWERFTGRGLEQDSGMGWTEDVYKDDLDRFLKLYDEGILKQGLFEIEYRLRRSDGVYRWTLCRANPVYGVAGDFVGFLGTCTDIHEQKLKEQKKDEFIGIASHEMKTPLTTAKAYLQLLAQSLPAENEQGNIYAEKAMQSIDRLHALITELLDVSKIQHGKLPYTMAGFDLNELVSETIGDLQCSLHQHRIVLSGSVKHEVVGDRNRLQQVLINLLSNAAKYSPDAHEVFVRLQEKEGRVEVSVRDKGIGLGKDHLENIFDRYFRVEEHAIQFQGLGIGLFISKEIVQRHGGTIWVESEKGRGSTFSFSLPV